MDRGRWISATLAAVVLFSAAVTLGQSRAPSRSGRTTDDADRPAQHLQQVEPPASVHQPGRGQTAIAPVQQPQREQPAPAPVQQPQQSRPVAAPEQQPQRTQPTFAPLQQPQRSQPAAAPEQQPQRIQTTTIPAIERQPLVPGTAHPDLPVRDISNHEARPAAEQTPDRTPSNPRPLPPAPVATPSSPGTPPMAGPVIPIYVDPVIIIQQDVDSNDPDVDIHDPIGSYPGDFTTGGTEQADSEATDSETTNPFGSWDQFSSFSSRYRAGYAVTFSSYAIGGSVSIPLLDLDRSELLIRTGISGFLYERENLVGDNTTSMFIPLSLAVKTEHYVEQLSNAEFTIYSTFGGGPALGMVFVPQYSDGSRVDDDIHMAVAGELFGSLGTELTLRNGQGVYCELGVSFLGIAGRTMSEQTSFVAPTLSLGFRFH